MGFDTIAGETRFLLTGVLNPEELAGTKGTNGKGTGAGTGAFGIALRVPCRLVSRLSSRNDQQNMFKTGWG